VDNSLNQLLAQYDYAHPESAVALEPASPRDAAKLLILDPDPPVTPTKAGAKNFVHDTFHNLTKHLPPKSLLVFNETKVIPARLEVTKPTGGKVRILYVEDLGKNTFSALADRPIDEGMSLVIPAKAGIQEKGISFEVLHRKGSTWIMRAHGVKKPVNTFLQHGTMPLPPYLKKTGLTEKEIREKYQTVFAKNTGSVAAPTASLHFTPRLMAALKKAGHKIVFVTLHVNLGTFAPLTEQHVKEGKLHEETYEIPTATAKAIAQAKKSGHPVIAVGTTAARALESATLVVPAKAGTQKTKKNNITGKTRLFIRPGYTFKVVDALITNFHVPRSSLLMLVSALTGRERLLTAYQEAIERGYKLFSFGDGMLILPKKKTTR